MTALWSTTYCSPPHRHIIKWRPFHAAKCMIGTPSTFWHKDNDLDMCAHMQEKIPRIGTLMPERRPAVSLPCPKKADFIFLDVHFHAFAKEQTFSFKFQGHRTKSSLLLMAQNYDQKKVRLHGTAGHMLD